MQINWGNWKLLPTEHVLIPELMLEILLVKTELRREGHNTRCRQWNGTEGSTHPYRKQLSFRIWSKNGFGIKTLWLACIETSGMPVAGDGSLLQPRENLLLAKSRAPLNPALWFCIGFDLVLFCSHLREFPFPSQSSSLLSPSLWTVMDLYIIPSLEDLFIFPAKVK